IEPRLPRPLLLVFGDTPVARALVQMGSLAGFRACAVHPGARPEDFPGAAMVVGSLEVAKANPGPDSWAVVATMGHYDEDALEAALAHRDVEVSLIASARRTDAVRKALMDRGLDETTLGRIRTSASKVRGGSQEEIAVLALGAVVTARPERRPAAKGGPGPAVVMPHLPARGMTGDQ